MSFYLTEVKNHIFYPINKILKQKISLPNLKVSRTNFSSPKGKVPKSGKRAAFRTLCTGSLTVEAAWSIPLFFLCIIALISLMEIYGMAVKHTIELQEEAEKTGMYAAAAENLPSQVIDCSRTVPYKLLGFPVPFPTLKIACRGRVLAWVGRQEACENGQQNIGSSQLVYITDYESVYHTTSRCSHLSLSISQLPAASMEYVRNEYGSRYHACEKCVGTGEKNAFLYITKQGDCYHNTLECSGLKRSVRLVELDSVGELKHCSRCQALESEGA